MSAYAQYNNRYQLRELFEQSQNEQLDMKTLFGYPPYYFLTDNLTIPYHQFGKAQYIDNFNIQYILNDQQHPVFAFKISKCIRKSNKDLIPQTGQLNLKSLDKSKQDITIIVQDVVLKNTNTGFISFYLDCINLFSSIYEIIFPSASSWAINCGTVSFHND